MNHGAHAVTSGDLAIGLPLLGVVALVCALAASWTFPGVRRLTSLALLSSVLVFHHHGHQQVGVGNQSPPVCCTQAQSLEAVGPQLPETLLVLELTLPPVLTIATSKDLLTPAIRAPPVGFV